MTGPRSRNIPDIAVEVEGADIFTIASCEFLKMAVVLRHRGGILGNLWLSIRPCNPTLAHVPSRSRARLAKLFSRPISHLAETLVPIEDAT
jgi:hypothetical protein